MLSAAGLRPAALLLASALLAGSCSSSDPDGPSGATRSVIHVPADAPTPLAAIQMSKPGDLILLAVDTYPGGLTVPKDHPDITIRGEDRNGVVFDGGDQGSDGITIAADGVAIENLTLHAFPGNGVVWHGVDGFAARYLTVWNAGGYGLYAFGSRNGQVERSLVSGAADAAFYIGECHPCDTFLRFNTATLSGIGYSGTNAGGGLIFHDSVFDRNGTGILPNSFDDEANPPQRDAVFSNNVVSDSGAVPTPASDPIDGLIGIGIGIAGGHHDTVVGNEVIGSDRYGIALFSTVQHDGDLWRPEKNRIAENSVAESGIADLAQAAGAAAGNCFRNNAATTALPVDLEETHRCGAGPTPAGGDERVSNDLEIPTPEAYVRSGEHPSYTEMPKPPTQESMPAPDATPGVPSPRTTGPSAEAIGLPPAALPKRYSL